MLAVTGQLTGSNVYAVIDAQNGTVYQTGGLAAFTTQSAAAYALVESPAGSERYRAPIPTLPNGSYGVTYFLREGSTPAVTDRPLGAEEITVGTGSLNVTIDPYNTPPEQVYSNGEVSVYQGTIGTIGVPVFNANGQPVALPASPTFKVYRDTFPTPQVIFQTAATTSGNTATVPYNSSQTAGAGRFRYQLLAGDGTILATGLFIIRPTVSAITPPPTP